MAPPQQVVVVRETKSSGAAILLSFLFPGLGQLYAGKMARGLMMMFVLTPAVTMTSIFAGCTGFLGGCATILGGIDPNAPPPPSGAAAVGFFGTLMTLLLPIYWIWSMVDANRLCKAFNRGEEA
ncbi:MAG TPA: hypothetical protein VGX03_21875 [Candidatus Binatia bacterium]|jgi:hypothetical protein|nr:hypothetical protein [Candidatus Binatia bacterium]